MTRIISIVGGMQPSTPTIGTATDGGTGTSVSVAFTASSYIGKGTITYTATSSPGGFTGTSATSPISVTGLTAGTAYTFTVTGTTNYGVSSFASASSNSVTPVAPGDFESIASANVSSVGTITFSSIPSTYSHLKLVCYLPQAAWGYYLVNTVNNDTSGIYSSATFQSDGSTREAKSTQNDTNFLVGAASYYWGSTTGGSVIYDYYNYASTSTYKYVRYQAGYQGANRVVSYGVTQWASTAAISTIKINIGGGSNTWSSGASIQLYGIK
jgi:hypothetical protein